MGSLTIRNLDDGLKASLRLRAARNGHSMEEEARIILRSVVLQREAAAPEPSVAEMFKQIFRPTSGITIDLPPHKLAREPPELSP